jgi:hypothetical protein
MTEGLPLPALMGSHPLGSLASFGLLRLVTTWDESARLAFRLQDDWIATLTAQSCQSVDSLIARLSQWAQSKELDRLLDWAEDVRVPPEKYRTLLGDAINNQDRTLVDFFGSIVCDGATDAQKGLAKPSAFYMVSGQQSFLDGMRQIVAEVRSAPEQSFAEALIGPWRYRTRKHGLGWDPNTERLYAMRHRAPTGEKPSCVAGAVLLAFWSLPLMPTVSKRGKALTIGFVRKGSVQYFSWPVFTVPIDLAELTSLLRASRQNWLTRDGATFRRGIETVFESLRFEFGKNYAVLRAARPATAASILDRS